MDTRLVEGKSCQKLSQVSPTYPSGVIEQSPEENVFSFHNVVFVFIFHCLVNMQWAFPSFQCRLTRIEMQRNVDGNLCEGPVIFLRLSMHLIHS